MARVPRRGRVPLGPSGPRLRSGCVGGEPATACRAPACVTVFGIAVRNGILLISNYQHLREGGEAFGSEMILKGSVERLAPILMTAATRALAIVPLVVAGDRPGHEIEHPMAIVILGGLASSTLLTLFVLPTVYARFGKGEAADLAP